MKNNNEFHLINEKLFDKIEKLWNENEKIGAIRLVVQNSNMSVLEAREFCEYNINRTK